MTLTLQQAAPASENYTKLSVPDPGEHRNLENSQSDHVFHALRQDSQLGTSIDIRAAEESTDGHSHCIKVRECSPRDIHPQFWVTGIPGLCKWSQVLHDSGVIGEHRPSATGFDAPVESCTTRGGTFPGLCDRIGWRR